MRLKISIIVGFIMLSNISYFLYKKYYSGENRDLSGVNLKKHPNLLEVDLRKVPIQTINAFADNFACSTDEMCEDFYYINNQLEEIEHLSE